MRRPQSTLPSPAKDIELVWDFGSDGVLASARRLLAQRQSGGKLGEGDPRATATSRISSIGVGEARVLPRVEVLAEEDAAEALPSAFEILARVPALNAHEPLVLALARNKARDVLPGASTGTPFGRLRLRHAGPLSREPTRANSPPAVAVEVIGRVAHAVSEAEIKGLWLSPTARYASASLSIAIGDEQLATSQSKFVSYLATPPWRAVQTQALLHRHRRALYHHILSEAALLQDDSPISYSLVSCPARDPSPEAEPVPSSSWPHSMMHLRREISDPAILDLFDTDAPFSIDLRVLLRLNTRFEKQCAESQSGMSTLMTVPLQILQSIAESRISTALSYDPAYAVHDLIPAVTYFVPSRAPLSRAPLTHAPELASSRPTITLLQSSLHFFDFVPAVVEQRLRLTEPGTGIALFAFHDEHIPPFMSRVGNGSDAVFHKNLDVGAGAEEEELYTVATHQFRNFMQIAAAGQRALAVLDLDMNFEPYDISRPANNRLGNEGSQRGVEYRGSADANVPDARPRFVELSPETFNVKRKAHAGANGSDSSDRDPVDVGALAHFLYGEQDPAAEAEAREYLLTFLPVKNKRKDDDDADLAAPEWCPEKSYFRQMLRLCITHSNEFPDFQLVVRMRGWRSKLGVPSFFAHMSTDVFEIDDADAWPRVTIRASTVEGRRASGCEGEIGTESRATDAVSGFALDMRSGLSLANLVSAVESCPDRLRILSEFINTPNPPRSTPSPGFERNKGLEHRRNILYTYIQADDPSALQGPRGVFGAREVPERRPFARVQGMLLLAEWLREVKGRRVLWLRLSDFLRPEVGSLQRCLESLFAECEKLENRSKGGGVIMIDGWNDFFDHENSEQDGDNIERKYILDAFQCFKFLVASRPQCLIIVSEAQPLSTEDQRQIVDPNYVAMRATEAGSGSGARKLMRALESHIFGKINFPQPQ